MLCVSCQLRAWCFRTRDCQCGAGNTGWDGHNQVWPQMRHKNLARLRSSGGLNPFLEGKGVWGGDRGAPFSSQKRLQMIRFKELPAIMSGPARQGLSRSASARVAVGGTSCATSCKGISIEWQNGLGSVRKAPLDLYARDPIGFAFLARLASTSIAKRPSKK